MRVVVVGATGNMGTAVLRSLHGIPDVELIGLARRRPAEPLDGVQFRTADVVHDDLVGDFRGADAVVHLGWRFQPTHRPERTWMANVGGSARVFEAVARASCRTLIYASSVGAYSPGRGEPVDETWPTHSLPTSAYGREKAYVERLLDGFQGEHPEVRVVRFRPGFVFQPGAGSQQRRLFAGPLLPRRLVQPGRLPVVPWPRGLRFQAVHADDLAAAYRAALTSDAAGAFNLAAEPVIDRSQVPEVFGGPAVDVPPALVRTGLAAAWRSRLVPAEPALLDLVLGLPLMRLDRARTVLGWEPQVSSIDAVRAGLGGMASGQGLPTRPLHEDSLGSRASELASGVGQEG